MFFFKSLLHFYQRSSFGLLPAMNEVDLPSFAVLLRDLGGGRREIQNIIYKSPVTNIFSKYLRRRLVVRGWYVW